LDEVWSAVTRGVRQVVFIGGEPGAGKSRFVAEASTILHRHDAAVLAGSCVAEFGAPYQPFVEPIEALITVLAAGDSFVTAAGEPDRQLQRRLKILAGRTSTEAGRTSERDYRRELYAAAAAVFCEAATRRPIVLALDDLQWAGETSLELLAYLVEHSAESRILILAAHRTTEPDRSVPLMRVITQLYRLDGVRRLDLAPLDAEAIVDYLVGETGIPARLTRTAATLLRDQTGGNPFFLREVWRDLSDRGGVAAVTVSALRAPQSVRDTLQVRLDRLAGAQRQTLQLAAVIGEEFDLALLLAADDATPDDTFAALDDAAALGLVEAAPGADGVFRFLHALGRQTVLDLTPPSWRIRAHGRIAEVLERQPGSAGERIPRLAHHYASAQALGHAAKAVEYLVKAARIADQSLAHRDAAVLFERAAMLAGDAELRDDLWLAAARSHFLGANFARARELDEQLAVTGEQRIRLRAAIGYEAACYRTGHPGDRAVELLTDALRVADRRQSDPTYVRAVACLGRALTFSGATREGREVGHRAVDLARAIGDGGVLAHALEASLWTELKPSDAAAGLERATELSDLARRTGNADHLGPTSYYRAIVSYAHARPDSLQSAHADLIHAANVTGQGLFEYMAGCIHYGRQFIAGEFADAEQTCEALLDIGESLGSVDASGPHGLQMYMIRRETGALEQVRPLITGHESPTTTWVPGLLALYTELTLTEAAARTLRWVLDRSLVTDRDSALWPGVLAFAVEAALALHDKSAAQRLRPLLGEYAGCNLIAGGFDAMFGSADRYLGSVDSLLGTGTPEAWFASALDLDTRMGAAIHQAHTIAARAIHLRRIGADGRRVETLTEQARALAEPIGLQRVLRLLGPGAAGKRPSPGPDGLSAREIEVLVLVASGLSNREISERLVISEHTAANHVRSILIKTGSANRTQAARYAAARGLLADGREAHRP
jgi:DNA-binding CsgD family transcriptional regulator